MKKTLFYLLTALFSVQSKQLPEFIRQHMCKLNMDNIDKCIVENGNKVIPTFAEGVPELNIATLDPLELQFIQLINTPQLSMNATSVKITGLKHMRLDKAELSTKAGFLSVSFKKSNLTLEGTYATNGQILVMPLRGSGPFSIILENGVYKATIKFSTMEKDGQKYFKIGDIGFVFSMDKVTFDLQNLFDGDAKLGKELNKFLNENWEALLDDLRPAITEVITRIVRDFVTKTTDSVPMDEIFPSK